MIMGCPRLIIVGQLSPCGSSDELDSDGDSNDIGSNFSNSNSSKRQKRGILPKHATSVMRAWLFQHLVVSLCPGKGVLPFGPSSDIVTTCCQKKLNSA